MTVITNSLERQTLNKTKLRSGKMINKIMRKKISTLSVASLCAIGSLSANAFEIENEGWTFSVHGNFNASYIYNTCDDNGALVVGAFLCGGDQDPNAITNGYLPTILEFGLSTTAGGYDIGVFSTFDRGLDTNEAFNVGDDGSGFRIWMTLGNESIGQILVGRAWGVFAYDSTFQDMSVSSVGGNFLVNNPVNTQLGAAGTGYIFLDRITQLTWTIPTSDQWVAQIGLFQPLNLSSFSFNSGTFAGAETGSELPGAHGRLRFNFNGGFISSTFLAQSVEASAGALTSDYTAYGIDLTGQYSFSNLTLTGTYHHAQGLGHTGYFIDAVDPTGEERDSDGYLLQATYAAGNTKYGINYGVNNLDDNAVDAGTAVLEEKTKITGGIYHTLASGVMLTGEYSHLEAENQAGGDIDNDVFSVGIILFF